MVWLFAEGGYNTRLEAIHDEEIPAGTDQSGCST